MKTFTIQIGGMSKTKYLKAFKKADITVSELAKELIEKIKFQKKTEMLELAVVSVADLGFVDWTRRDEIYKKAQEQYDLVPAEAGLSLRLAYKDQPMYEWLYMGMEPITARDGNPNVFDVDCRDGGLWLHGRIANPGYDWHDGRKFMFRLRKLSPLHPKELSSDPLALSNFETRLAKLEEDMAKVKPK